MAGQIRANECNGRGVEKLIAKRYGGTLVDDRINPFDVVTDRALIEVKSCKPKTITKKIAEKVYFIPGRFMVCPKSHQRLREEAEQQGKDYFYVFVIREGKIREPAQYPNTEDDIRIVDSRELRWIDVDKILKKAKTTKRSKDGVENVCIRSEEIFGQKKLVP